jgi:hypothetical protein
MRILELKAIQAAKFKVTTDSNHTKPVAPDLIEQGFTATAPNQKWCTDITYVWTDEGWLYLAVVMDLYSRAIVGWSMQPRMTQQLVCDALTMALCRRGLPTGVIVHSDRGSQYCSKRYQRLLIANGLRCSMGRKATYYDNAAMESFFHTRKVELIHRDRYVSRHSAKSSIFKYIETYYNRQRKHSATGYRCSLRRKQLKPCVRNNGGGSVLCACGPDEGFWILVMHGDILIDDADEFRNAGKDSAAQPLGAQIAEESLHHVQPGGRRCEVHVKAWMLGKPGAHLGVFMGGVVVTDQMQFFALGGLPSIWRRNANHSVCR